MLSGSDEHWLHSVDLLVASHVFVTGNAQLILSAGQLGTC